MVKKCPEDVFNMMVDVRRTLHRNPEIAFKEYATAELIIQKLTELGIEFQSQVGETGVIGFIKGENKGPVGAIRADMDALTINEAKTVEYRSQVSGAMHACGHDGHTAMLLGAATILSRQKERICGGIKLIFQPAEEGSLGAKALIEAGVLKNPDVDFILGIHMWPELPVGKIGIQYGITMSCSGHLRIEVKGLAAHAGTPHKGIDAIVPASNLVLAIRSYLSQGFEPGEMVTISIGTIEGGYSRSVIADRVVLKGTTRSITEEGREVIFENIIRIAHHICKAYSADCHVKLEKGSPPSYNNQKTTRTVEETVRNIFGSDSVEIIKKIPMTSEDFGRYLQLIPGTFIKIGCSNKARGFNEPLHSVLFNFDERVMALGSVVMAESAIKILRERANEI